MDVSKTIYLINMPSMTSWTMTAFKTLDFDTSNVIYKGSMDFFRNSYVVGRMSSINYLPSPTYTTTFSVPVGFMISLNQNENCLLIDEQITTITPVNDPLYDIQDLTATLTFTLTNSPAAGTMDKQTYTATDITITNL